MQAAVPIWSARQWQRLRVLPVISLMFDLSKPERFYEHTDDHSEVGGSGWAADFSLFHDFLVLRMGASALAVSAQDTIPPLFHRLINQNDDLT